MNVCVSLDKLQDRPSDCRTNCRGVSLERRPLLVSREEQNLRQIKSEIYALRESINVHIVGDHSDACAHLLLCKSLPQLVESICYKIEL